MARMRAMCRLCSLGKSLPPYFTMPALLTYKGCLGDKQKKAVLARLQEREGPVEHGRAKIKHVGVDEEASFLCARCDTSPGCMVCHQDKMLKNVEENAVEDKTRDKDAKDADGDVEMKEDKEEDVEEMLRFRCLRCKQEAHYEHSKQLVDLQTAGA